MSEKVLRNVFIFGTIFFFVILGALTWDSLSAVTENRTPELTDEVVAGKRTWQGKNCNDCHTILGIGGYYAPELTKVSDRWDDSDLKRFLKDPQATMPGATMPNQDLSDEEIANLVAFFNWVGGVNTNGWPPEPMQGKSSDSSSGETLFSQKGCIRCHSVDGVGTGMDLSGVGSDRDEAWLEEWLEDPQAKKPGTTMPNPHLSEEEAHSLADWLAGQK